MILSPGNTGLDLKIEIMYYVIVRFKSRHSPDKDFYDIKTFTCFSLEEAEETFARQKEKMIMSDDFIEVSMRKFN